jgi:hypothetical protein
LRVYNWLSFLKINLGCFSVPKKHITHYPQTFFYSFAAKTCFHLFSEASNKHIKTYIIYFQFKLNTYFLIHFAARPLRSVFPGASRPAAGRPDLPVLAHPRRGQLALERKVSRGRFAR